MEFFYPSRQAWYIISRQAVYHQHGKAVLLTVIASLILTAIYHIFSNPIITMFGGTVNEETFRHSKEYFFWITLGIPFYMFGQAMNPVIRADGVLYSMPAADILTAIVSAVIIAITYKQLSDKKEIHEKK